MKIIERTRERGKQMYGYIRRKNYVVYKFYDCLGHLLTVAENPQEQTAEKNRRRGQKVMKCSAGE